MAQRGTNQTQFSQKNLLEQRCSSFCLAVAGQCLAHVCLPATMPDLHHPQAYPKDPMDSFRSESLVPCGRTIQDIPLLGRQDRTRFNSLKGKNKRKKYGRSKFPESRQTAINLCKWPLVQTFGRTSVSLRKDCDAVPPASSDVKELKQDDSRGQEDTITQPASSTF